ncbi:MAG TPA: hypothetical protein VM432_11380, partial [Bdellovibrionales bacterium]|nr:hypothetical protein [Bdellovibrionales bacterium]
ETFVFKEAGKVTLLKDMPEMYLATYEPQPPGRPAVTCRISEIGGVKACDTEQVFFNAMSIYVDLDSDGVKEEIYQINPEFGFEFWVRRLNRENLEFKDSFRFLPVVQLEKENGVAKFELSDLAGTDLVVDYSKVGTRIRALPFHCFTEFSTTFSLLEAMFFPLVEFKRHVRAESKNTKFSGPELQWVSLADLEKVPAAYKAAATCTKDADCVLTKYTDGALVSNRSFKVPTYCKDDPTWTSFEEFNRLQQYDAFRQPPPRCDKKHKTCD